MNNFLLTGMLMDWLGVIPDSKLFPLILKVIVTLLLDISFRDGIKR
jgi:hypothetical protein